MMQLAARIRERGGEAKEPLWYKHEYLRRLDLRIKDRIDGLRQGTIPADDLLVHGARRLLENLKDRGLPVYLASGTDEIFLKQEAELLGLTPYFGAGSTAPRMISRRSPRSWSSRGSSARTASAANSFSPSATATSRSGNPVSVHHSCLKRRTYTGFPPQGYLIEDGDILFTRYNGSVELLSVSGMVRGCSEPTLHPDKLIRVKTVLGEPFPSFLEIASNVGVSRQHLERRARTTAGQTGISGTDIREMPLPVPPLDEQKQIVQEVERRLSIADEIEAQIVANLKRAARLGQGILKRAFEGRLVPQDPTDEPAEKLLERIRQQRQPATKMYNGRLGTRRARRPRRTSDPLLPFPRDDGNGQGGKPWDT